MKKLLLFTFLVHVVSFSGYKSTAASNKTLFTIEPPIVIFPPKAEMNKNKTLLVISLF